MMNDFDAMEHSIDGGMADDYELAQLEESFKRINETFVFNSIRKYNRATRQTQKDVILHAVGVHCELIQKKRSPLPTLSEAEREVVLSYLQEFLRSQELEILLNP